MEQADRYYICRYAGGNAPSGQPFLDFWNKSTGEWQTNDPSEECRYDDANQAHEDLGKTGCQTAWVGNRYFQAVDRNGKLTR